MYTQLEILLNRAKTTGVGAPNIPWCGTRKIFSSDSDTQDIVCKFNEYERIIRIMKKRIRKLEKNIDNNDV